LRFARYPKIFRVGHVKAKGVFDKGTIVVEEKMDGANVRWMYDEEQDIIRFGSRNSELTNAKDFKQFKKFAEWVKQLDANDLEPNMIYYAEYMIPHTIQYDWDKVPMLLGFDVYNPCEKNPHFVSYDKSVELFEALGVQFVPIIDVVHSSEITKNYLDKVIPESKYYNGKAEGVVFKNYECQKFAKLVAEEFKEVNEKVFGTSPKRFKETQPERYLLEKYVTPRRVEKVIRQLISEGYELNMSLMSVLPQRVWQDVIEEEAFNIFKENLTFNPKQFARLIPKRCVNVLQRCIALKEIDAF